VIPLSHFYLYNQFELSFFPYYKGFVKVAKLMYLCYVSYRYL